jgi:hypothetical protein
MARSLFSVLFLLAFSLLFTSDAQASIILYFSINDEPSSVTLADSEPITIKWEITDNQGSCYGSVGAITLQAGSWLDGTNKGWKHPGLGLPGFAPADLSSNSPQDVTIRCTDRFGGNEEYATVELVTDDPSPPAPPPADCALVPTFSIPGTCSTNVELPATDHGDSLFVNCPAQCAASTVEFICNNGILNYITGTCNAPTAPPPPPPGATCTIGFCNDNDTYRCTTNSRQKCVNQCWIEDACSTGDQCTGNGQCTTPTSGSGGGYVFKIPPEDAPKRPIPSDAGTNVSTTTILNWEARSYFDKFNVYLGTTNPPPKIRDKRTDRDYEPSSPLLWNKTYYWKVVAFTEDDLAIDSPIWTFTTEQKPDEPISRINPPHEPRPENGAINVPNPTTLKWNSDLDDVSFDIYFGESNPPRLHTANLQFERFDPGFLRNDASYFWRVASWSNNKIAVSPVWTFRTAPLDSIEPTSLPPAPPSPAAPTPRTPAGNKIDATAPPPVVPPVRTQGSDIEIDQAENKVFFVGDTVEVEEILNVREGPSKTQRLIAAQPTGAQGKIVDGPKEASGFTWFEVRFDKEPHGWVVGDFLKLIKRGESVAPKKVPVVKDVKKILEISLINKNIDSDNDGLSDYDEENIYGTDPNLFDSDNDGDNDLYELLNQTSPFSSSTISTAYEDAKASEKPISEVLTLNKVKGKRENDSPHDGPFNIVFSGSAPPNAIITLYIYSTPIIVTVLTDSEGNWEYTLTRELENGSHEVYVALTDAEGGIFTKSAGIELVKTADAAGFADLVPALPEATQKPSFFSPYYLGGALALLLIILAAILILLGRHKREEESHIRISDFKR